jgi:hypothetical protein
MRVYIAGEDPVTKAIIKRVLSHCSGDVEIILELPARGSQIKSKINEFNILSLSYPVILLTDLDADSCAPVLVRKLMPENKNDNFIINIAVDEAEAWLMADREGFSKYFGVPLDKMPKASLSKQGGMKPLMEMNLPYKSSLFLTSELINEIENSGYIQQLTPKKGAAKGPEYNSCMLPFIQERWNIDSAQVNSNSLERMIGRINRLIKKK